MSSIENLEVSFNSQGWGPVLGASANAFDGMIYSNFDKKERITRCAELGMSHHFGAKNRPWLKTHSSDHSGNQDFNAQVANDAFMFVDSASRSSKSNKKGGYGNNQANNKTKSNIKKNDVQAMKNLKNKSNGKRNAKYDRAPALTPKADWDRVPFDELDLGKVIAKTLKIGTDMINEVVPEDLLWTGKLCSYNDAFEKNHVRSSRLAKRDEYDTTFYNINPVLDDNLLRLFDEGDVFTTDSILAHLIVSFKSSSPWDIVIEKAEDKIFIGRRPDSDLESFTVSESSSDCRFSPVASDINAPGNLSSEAVSINQRFISLVLTDNVRSEFEPSFGVKEGDKPAPIAYRYRVFNIKGKKLVVRCEVHGKDNKDNFVNCFSFHDWGSRKNSYAEYLKNSQSGSMLTEEFKDNSFKVAKWYVQSFLAGVSTMKFGFVSRVNTNIEHEVVHVQSKSLDSISQSVAFSPASIWSGVKFIMDMLSNLSDGKFVLLKDANKSSLAIYSVPQSTFEVDEMEENIDEAEETAN